MSIEVIMRDCIYCDGAGSESGRRLQSYGAFTGSKSSDSECWHCGGIGKVRDRFAEIDRIMEAQLALRNSD